MENILLNRINQYKATTNKEYINAIREVIQELTLFSLSKTDFFTKVAFLGGTALRIFYDLDRASEDLDFSLIKKDKNFSLDDYLPAIEKNMNAFGLAVSVQSKKSIGAVQSAFVKGDTITNLINIGLNEELSKRLGHISSIKVKIEIDTNPPSGATFEYKYGLFPSPYRVLIYDESSLLAGKLHALLCRNWTKGRDYYDYVFYLNRGTKPNMDLLKNSLIQTGFLKSDCDYNIDNLKADLINRLDSVDFEEAKKDCSSFIKNENKLSLWNKDFFVSITSNYLN